MPFRARDCFSSSLLTRALKVTNLDYPIALLSVRDKRLIVTLPRQTLAADTQLALYHGQVGVEEYHLLLPHQSLLVCRAGAVLIIRFHGTEGVRALPPSRVWTLTVILSC